MTRRLGNCSTPTCNLSPRRTRWPKGAEEAGARGQGHHLALKSNREISRICLAGLENTFKPVTHFVFRVAVPCLGHHCPRGTRQRADHFSILGTKVSVCIPETANLEMLDPCLGGKGKIDVAEGALESAPAVTKSHQLGWVGGL